MQRSQHGRLRATICEKRAPDALIQLVRTLAAWRPDLPPTASGFRLQDHAPSLARRYLGCTTRSPISTRCHRHRRRAGTASRARTRSAMAARPLRLTAGDNPSVAVRSRFFCAMGVSGGVVGQDYSPSPHEAATGRPTARCTSSLWPLRTNREQVLCGEATSRRPLQAGGIRCLSATRARAVALISARREINRHESPLDTQNASAAPNMRPSVLQSTKAWARVLDGAARTPYEMPGRRLHETRKHEEVRPHSYETFQLSSPCCRASSLGVHRIPMSVA